MLVGHVVDEVMAEDIRRFASKGTRVERRKVDVGVIWSESSSREKRRPPCGRDGATEPHSEYWTIKSDSHDI